MKKILILGATGFIGRNMVERFAANTEYEVHAVNYNSPQYDIANVKWHNCDLTSEVVVDHLLKGMDIVIQAAATTSGSKDIVNTPAMHVTDNAVMNSYIFRAAVASKVKHLIFFSCTVMYPSGHVPVREDVPLGVNPKYFGVAHTKLYCEKMCDFYSRLGQTKFTAIRHSNIYGPYDKYDLERSHVFGATVTKVMTAEENVVIWGNGEEARDLLHVEDLCDFVGAVLSNQKEDFALYNCGYGVAFKIKDLVQRIILASGKNLTISYDLSAPSIPTTLSLNCDKARKELGWWPKVALGDGIKRTLEWWKENYAG